MSVGNVSVEFLFDFGSPNVYLAHLLVPAIESRTGVRFRYVPTLLGGVFKLTGNVSPVISMQGVKNKPEYQGLEMRRFLRDHEIESFQMNPHFPVNTLQIMRGAIVAERLGVLKRYVDEVLRYMWSEPRKMDDPEVIREALDESGFDADAILEGTRDPEVKARLIANTEDAVSRGVFGAPSFIVGDELFFGKDRLDAVEREILRQAKEAGG